MACLRICLRIDVRSPFSPTLYPNSLRQQLADEVTREPVFALRHATLLSNEAIGQKALLNQRGELPARVIQILAGPLLSTGVAPLSGGILRRQSHGI